MFQRSATYATTHPRIKINNGNNIAFESADQVQLGTYVRETGQTQTVNNNATNTTIFTVDSTDVRAFRVDYTIVRDTGTRTGTFTVVASTDGTGATLATDDSGTQNTSIGVTLSAAETAGVVTVRYSSTNTGLSGNLYYSITRLA
jgi:hypothetical protein